MRKFLKGIFVTVLILATMPAAAVVSGLSAPDADQVSWPPLQAVFTQSAAAVSRAEYEVADKHWQGLRYRPVVLSSSNKHEPMEYSGVWYKDREADDWKVGWDIPLETLSSEHDARRKLGFEAIEIDACHINGDLLFNVIWTKAKGAPATRIDVELSAKDLMQKVSALATERFRPARLDAYTVDGMVRYAVLSVQDGAQAQVEANLTKRQLASMSARLLERGYIASDLSSYLEDDVVHHAGVWVQDARVLDHEIGIDLSRSEFESRGLFRRKDNYILADLDSYDTAYGNQRFSAIWHRIYPKDQLFSNVSLNSNPVVDELWAIVNELRGNGKDGKSASIGFRIEDLTNGHYLAFNPKEHFYLASTRKVILATTLIKTGVDLDIRYELKAADYRATPDEPKPTEYQATPPRGLTKDDFGKKFSIRDFMRNMLGVSDNTSADLLKRLIAEIAGEGAPEALLWDVVGATDFSEFTTAAEFDKRIMERQDPAIREVPNHTFEAWRRENDRSFATESDHTIFDRAGRRTPRSAYDAYYAELANSMSPDAYSAFYRRLAAGDILSVEERGVLLANMGQNEGYGPGRGEWYDDFRSKGGSKAFNKSKTGIAWNYAGEPGDTTNVIPQYSFCIFTKNWEGGMDGDTAEQGMIDILRTSLQILRAHRNAKDPNNNGR
jgi:beta-lactamase class A